jgi:hypothetical protein
VVSWKEVAIVLIILLSRVAVVSWRWWHPRFHMRWWHDQMIVTRLTPCSVTIGGLQCRRHLVVGTRGSSTLLRAHQGNAESLLLLIDIPYLGCEGTHDFLQSVMPDCKVTQ